MSAQTARPALTFCRRVSLLAIGGYPFGLVGGALVQDAHTRGSHSVVPFLILLAFVLVSAGALCAALKVLAPEACSVFGDRGVAGARDQPEAVS